MGGSMLLHGLPLRAAALWLCTSVALFLAVTADIVQTTKPGCASRCGNLTFSYPFGMSDGGNDCYFKIKSNSFGIFCDSSTDPPTPYVANKSSNLRIVNVSAKNHEMSVMMFVANDCYDSSGKRFQNNDPTLTLAEFPLSSAKNKFVAVGCDTNAIISGRKGSGNYATGCISFCGNISDVSDGSCSGIGCCEASIPRETYGYDISVGSYYNHTNVSHFNPCGYAFVAEDGFFNFSTSYLHKLPFDVVPLVLDWFIPGQTCEDAKKHRSSYMCKGKSNCTDAENGKGYTCNCREGFEGNPYLQNGCQGFLF